MPISSVLCGSEKSQGGLSRTPAKWSPGYLGYVLRAWGHQHCIRCCGAVLGAQGLLGEGVNVLQWELGGEGQQGKVEGWQCRDGMGKELPQGARVSNACPSVQRMGACR